MPVIVPFDLSYEIDVKAPAAEVFDLLADVPASASHFPKVERLVDLGDHSYRWELQKVGTEQVHIQTIYAAKYLADRKTLRVSWTPVPGIGNALIGGSWSIAERKHATHVKLHIRGEIHVPLPGLMKLLVAPVVIAENEKLVRQYLQNLVHHFGGKA